ncbi:MAG: hypothetical protein ABIA93_03060 [Candidatus Woesearchaeota archaeon]
MKLNYVIPILVIVGITVLFFFPEPETNFLLYVATALFFIAVIVFLVVWNGKKNNSTAK